MRVRTLHVMVGEPTRFEWCEVCNFTELAVFPLTSIDDEGVAPFGAYRRCLRCKPIEDGGL